VNGFGGDSGSKIREGGRSTTVLVGLKQTKARKRGGRGHAMVRGDVKNKASEKRGIKKELWEER